MVAEHRSSLEAEPNVATMVRLPEDAFEIAEYYQAQVGDFRVLKPVETFLNSSTRIRGLQALGLRQWRSVCPLD